MIHHNIAGRRFLVVEDEYYLADDVRSVLSQAGAEVVGPLATLDEAQAFIASGAGVDGVFLDVNLRGSLAFGLADTLQAQDVPFAFITGYDMAALPTCFADVPKLQKPASSEALVRIASDLAAARNEMHLQ